MQTIFFDTSRKDHVFFDLTCCINELHGLHQDLSMLDMEALKQVYKKLRDFIESKSH